MKYKVKMSVEADADFENYLNHIICEYDAPLTAVKHKDGILDVLLDLSVNPYVNAVRHNEFLLEFGMNVRRANYKRMAIIYTIHENVVYVHRILAGSMVIGLN